MDCFFKCKFSFTKIFSIRKFLILSLLVLHSQNTFSVEQPISVTVNPFGLLIFGIIDAGAEYRLGKDEISEMPLISEIPLKYRHDIGIGVNLSYWDWDDNIVYDGYTILALQGYGRYYLNDEKNGFFAGAGMMYLSYEYTYRNWLLPGEKENVTSSTIGITAEGGYQWRWDHLYVDAGYELLLGGTIDSDGSGSSPKGTDFVGFKSAIGWYF